MNAACVHPSRRTHAATFCWPNNYAKNSPLCGVAPAILTLHRQRGRARLKLRLPMTALDPVQSRLPRTARIMPRP